MGGKKVELHPGEASIDVRKAAADAAKRMDEGSDVPPDTIVNPPTKASAPVETKGKAKGKAKPTAEKGTETVQDAKPAADKRTDAEPAADASDAKPGGKKGRGSKAIPAKGVNPRRVIEPKVSGTTVVPGTPIEKVQATPDADAPKRGPGRPKGSTIGQKPSPGTDLSVPLPTGPLSDIERFRLAELETIVTRGMESFITVGNALIEIKTGALYRATHADYESYLRDRWDISPRQERHLTGGVVARKVLASAGVTDLPTNESQTRFLVGVPDEKKPATWNLALEKAKADGRDAPTRDHVKAAADEIGRVSPRAGIPRSTATTADGTAVPRKTDAEIARAQESGVLPENVTIDVTPDDEPDDGLTNGPPEDISMDDDKWLAKLPIREKLSDRCRQIFDADAMAYRWLDSARVGFIRNAFRPILKEARKASSQWLGPYTNRMLYTLRTAHPSKWVVCPSCKGSGQREGGKGECGDCKKCGYRLP